MQKRKSSLSSLIFEITIRPTHSHRMISLSDAAEVRKCRQNDPKSLRTKKSDHRAKAERKLKEISKWDDFCAELANIE